MGASRLAPTSSIDVRRSAPGSGTTPCTASRMGRDRAGCGWLVKPLEWCGMMGVSLAETRVSAVTRGTITASRRRRLTGSEGGLQGARTGSGTPICIFTANVSNVLLVGARRGTRKRPAAPTNSLKDKVAETRLGGFSVTESRRGTGTKEADLTGPGRNSKVGRVAPELQTKV